MCKGNFNISVLANEFKPPLAASSACTGYKPCLCLGMFALVAAGFDVFNRTLNFKADSRRFFRAISAKTKGQKLPVCRLILLLMSHGLRASMDFAIHR